MSFAVVEHPRTLTVVKELISMSIYTLYVKTHRKTGLKYLGITKKKNVQKYHGSGVRWTNHILEHGYDCETEILLTTGNLTELSICGEYYSRLWDVVNSDQWANLKPETGYGGAIKTGMVVVYDTAGNTVYIEKDDPRIQTGEFVYVGKMFNSGMVVVKDKFNNTLQVSNTDPRYLSGELRHVNYGKKHPKTCCKFCNKQIDKIQQDTHEKSCLKNPNRIPGNNYGRKFLVKTSNCKFCNRQISLGNIARHESKCPASPLFK